MEHRLHSGPVWRTRSPCLADSACWKWSNKLPLEPRRFTWCNTFQVSWVASVGGQLGTRGVDRIWVRGRQRTQGQETTLLSLSLCRSSRLTCNCAETKWLRFAKTRIFFHPTFCLSKNRADFAPLATRCREQTAAAVRRHLQDDFQSNRLVERVAQRIERHEETFAPAG